MNSDKMAALEELLTRKISDHPTMQRLAVLCDAMERVLKRKSAGASESDSTKDRAREDWKALAKKAHADAPHG